MLKDDGTTTDPTRENIVSIWLTAKRANLMVVQRSAL